MILVCRKCGSLGEVTHGDQLWMYDICEECQENDEVEEGHRIREVSPQY